MLRRLVRDALGDHSTEDWPRGLTMCAPRWVLDRISAETGVPVGTDGMAPTITAESLVLTAVPTLEREGGIGFLAAVDVITGRCLELTACHPDVPPNRWPDLTLALICGLGSAASVAIEMIGARDA